ncbi:Carnitine O-acetyltransferase [Zancudomyces culisetae]|uniref:Carnitine O-acetyltransferase n=1 Tax=Zancudomyces culisetae TaxID=1213189 RepID=A0A1R1PYP5_ZANCU|nr:Carnitine O-acetyltransferase [Zancudomyces culisetae]|eukprot:OMH86080.1 Carnitine O-acetyltransferase [Zancudomyces culisetae]
MFTLRSGIARFPANKRALNSELRNRKHSTGATVGTFDNQDLLPKLPIPTLKQTAERYLKTLEPLQTKDEFRDSTHAVNSFISNNGGLGPILQQRLFEYSKSQKKSWLENIWLNKAYLEYREPCYLNVNWYATIAEPPGAQMPKPSEVKKGVHTAFQLQRASVLINHLLDFNDKLNQGKVEPEYQRNGKPFCMDQFKRQFGCSRIPKLQCDEIVSSYPCAERHITVIYKDQIFKVNVYDQQGSRVSDDGIYNQLNQLISQVENSHTQKQAAIGIFTAANRDVWATVRQGLIDISPANTENLRTIETALFSVSLDTEMDVDDSYDIDKRAQYFLKSKHGENRWYDKPIELLVLNNGHVGLNCEHTPVDALTTGRIIVEALAKEKKGVLHKTGSTDLPPPALLKWQINQDILDKLEAVKAETLKFANNVNLKNIKLEGIGSETAKKAQISPDSLAQMAIQLTYYRIHGRATATYEAAGTRSYLGGRTECVRVASNESLAFVKAIDNPSVTNARKMESLIGALGVHAEYMKAAGSGYGVDRHLLGLRCMLDQANPDELAKATLFNDPGYLKSMYFELSTSNVSPARDFQGGFAPVVPSGYGVGYGLDKNCTRAIITTWENYKVPEGDKKTDISLFSSTLGKSLNDILHLATD